MVDFEKASINSLESHFTASTSGCFFHLSQNIYRKIQTEGLAQEYIQDMEYGIKLKMLASLAFVPETDVIDSFNILMAEFPQSASNIENYYIGKSFLTILVGYLLFLSDYGTCTQGYLITCLVLITVLKDGTTPSNLGYAMRTQAFLSF